MDTQSGEGDLNWIRQRSSTKKCKRIKGLPFWFLLACQVPVLAMWASGYKGYFFPAWLALDWLLKAYFRATTTTYVQRMGAYGFIDQVNTDIRAYQERPWYLLLPIPLFLGFSAMLRLATKPEMDQWLSRACTGCLILIFSACFIEGLRKIRI